MASIKVKLSPPRTSAQEGIIYYQVNHNRSTRTIISEHRLFPAEWDNRKESIIPPQNYERHIYLVSVREKIQVDLKRLNKIIRKLEISGFDYTVNNIVEEFNRYLTEYTLFNYMIAIIARLRKNGKIRTSETYKSALSSFRKYRKQQDIPLDYITAEIMEEYEAWLISKGRVRNTISFYIRILRAVYNRAIENNLIENQYPFRKVYTGIDKTIKRALPLNILKRIKSIDLSPYRQLDFARDMFLLSFYLRGMSFIDMAFLRKSDLRNGCISYRRRKTGQLLTIKWTPQMQSILDKYPENKSSYLLPIIRESSANDISAYRNAGYAINHNLKRVGKILGLEIPLTLYVARHSWASIAQAKGIPLSVISAGMGHNNETTTQIYLSSLATSVVDKANDTILKGL